MGKEVGYIKEIILKVRESLSFGSTFSISNQEQLAYNPKISQVYITLFQEGLKPIRWGSRKKHLKSQFKELFLSLKLILIFIILI